MKRLMYILMLGIVCVVCAMFYVFFDSKGYDYGYGCVFCDKELPYNIEPQINRYYYITLVDEEGFELVGGGFRYRRSSFTIKDFLAYGYNDTSIVIKCTDSLNNIRYLLSYKTEYKSIKSNPTISFKDVVSVDSGQVQANYKWVDVDKEKAKEVQRRKSFLFVCLLFLFSLFMWQLRYASEQLHLAFLLIYE